MRASLVTLLVAALALLLAAVAQAAGAEPTPPKHASQGVKDVYADYNADSRLTECDHTREDLQQTVDTMSPATADDFPDFVDEVSVALGHHQQSRCANDQSASSTPEATTAPPSTSGSAPPPAASPESGQLPEGEGASPESGALPPDQAVPPAAGASPAPVTPPATTPAPVTTPAATPAATITHEGHRSLTVPAIILALVLLGAVALALSALAGRRSPGVRHAWREAAFRTRGTWADFSDWLRLGR